MLWRAELRAGGQSIWGHSVSSSQSRKCADIVACVVRCLARRASVTRSQWCNVCSMRELLAGSFVHAKSETITYLTCIQADFHALKLHGSFSKIRSRGHSQPMWRNDSSFLPANAQHIPHSTSVHCQTRHTSKMSSCQIFEWHTVRSLTYMYFDPIGVFDEYIKKPLKRPITEEKKLKVFDH